jgi:arginine repressor
MPKKQWNDILPQERRKIVNGIKQSILKSVVLEDVPSVLKAVFTKQFDFGLHLQSQNYATTNAIVSNISKELNIIKQREHQSGVFKAIVSACSGANIKNNDLANLLRIHRNSITKVQYYFMYILN